MSEKLPSEEALTEELISLEHPVKPHHVPEPEESDEEFSAPFVCDDAYLLKRYYHDSDSGL